MIVCVTFAMDNLVKAEQSHLQYVLLSIMTLPHCTSCLHLLPSSFTNPKHAIWKANEIARSIILAFIPQKLSGTVQVFGESGCDTKLLSPWVGCVDRHVTPPEPRTRL